MIEEFDNLFSSLYEDHETYIKIVRLIPNRRYGIGQEELLKHFGKALQGNTGLKRLKDLQDAGFIISFKPHFHSRKGIYYKAIDESSPLSILIALAY